jgi:hypothetical protein
MSSVFSEFFIFRNCNYRFTIVAVAADMELSGYYQTAHRYPNASEYKYAHHAQRLLLF